MNGEQKANVLHAIRNQNRFYTEANDKLWSDLVEKGYATKHPGWEDDMAYFRVTSEGRQVAYNS